MNCSAVDLKAYFLGETAPAEKNSVENHLHACQSCREELDRLKLTETALRSLEDEEIPQRIAFVSDKVFEPRWWQTIWRSGPAMGFASAAMLAAAILAHAYVRPVPSTNPASVDSAQIQQRIDAAVAKAVGETEARQAQQVAKALDAAEKRYELQREKDMAIVQQVARYYDQQAGRLMAAMNQDRAGQ